MASSVCLGNCARTANSTGIPHDGVGGCVFGLFCRAVAPKHAARARCALAYARHGSSGPAPTLAAGNPEAERGGSTNAHWQARLPVALSDQYAVDAYWSDRVSDQSGDIPAGSAGEPSKDGQRSQPCGAGLTSVGRDAHARRNTFPRLAEGGASAPLREAWPFSLAADNSWDQATLLFQGGQQTPGRG